MDVVTEMLGIREYLAEYLGTALLLLVGLYESVKSS